MIDFAVPAAVAEQAARVRAFVERHCEPLEARAATGALPESELLALREVARLEGLLVPQAGLDHRGTAIVLEAAGRSVLGPIALNCAAPDEGNMALLDRLATSAQRERYLAPLLEGRIRSCFCMTEPTAAPGRTPRCCAPPRRPTATAGVSTGASG